MKPEERPKAIVALVLIVGCLLYTFISIKKKHAPTETAATPSVTASAGTTATPGPVPAATPPAAAATEVLPEGPVKVVVRDPFATTPGYKRKLATSVNGSLGGPPSLGSLSGPGALPKITSSYTPPSDSGWTVKPSGLSGLPPADINFGKLPESSESVKMAKAAPLPRPVPQAKTEGSAPEKGASSTAATATVSTPAAPAQEEALFALTGTVDGDTPMAILRSNNRNYLVREGDWLEGDLQVRRISPRQVVLKERTGRSRVLNLGASSNAT